MTLSEFEQYAHEHNIVPVSADIYQKMISDSVMLAKYKEVLQEIRQEIEKKMKDICTTFQGEQAYRYCLDVIDKHIAEGNYAQ